MVFNLEKPGKRGAILPKLQRLICYLIASTGFILNTRHWKAMAPYTALVQNGELDIPLDLYNNKARQIVYSGTRG